MSNQSPLTYCFRQRCTWRLGRDFTRLTEFKAHRKELTTFSFVEMNEKCLLSASYDGYVRIWSLQGDMQGNMNVNHPLPVTWKLSMDVHEKLKRNVFFALKILDVLSAKYRENLKEKREIEKFILSLIPSAAQNIKQLQASKQRSEGRKKELLAKV